LNATLKKHGVSKRGIRRKICDRFLFAFGNFHDQYWFKTGGKKFYPLLCFSEKFLDTDTKLVELGNVHVPYNLYSLHDAAAGNVEWFFEDQKEKKDPIPAGCVGGQKKTDPSSAALPPTGWIGGEQKAGTRSYVWADHPTGPVEFRIRQGPRKVVHSWTPLPKKRGMVPFGDRVVFEKSGKYEVDFRCGEKVFSVFKATIT
jgi:hypothetical protein